MLNIFSQISNLAAGTLAVAAAVTNAAPQVSSETHKQATLDLAGVALAEAAKVAGASTANVWVTLGAELLPAIYNEVMLVANKRGLIAASASTTAAPATASVTALSSTPATPAIHS